MPYPIIFNGDHAAFEIEHVNTKPEDRPDWPLPSFDALDWARAFCKLNPTMDEGLMITWFANALMRGFDERASRVQQHTVVETCLTDKCPRGGKSVHVLHVD